MKPNRWLDPVEERYYCTDCAESDDLDVTSLDPDWGESDDVETCYRCQSLLTDGLTTKGFRQLVMLAHYPWHNLDSTVSQQFGYVEGEDYDIGVAVFRDRLLQRR